MKSQDEHDPYADIPAELTQKTTPDPRVDWDGLVAWLSKSSKGKMLAKAVESWSNIKDDFRNEADALQALLTDARKAADVPQPYGDEGRRNERIREQWKLVADRFRLLHEHHLSALPDLEAKELIGIFEDLKREVEAMLGKAVRAPSSSSAYSSSSSSSEAGPMSSDSDDDTDEGRIGKGAYKAW
jgi:hypothetical protein